MTRYSSFLFLSLAKANANDAQKSRNRAIEKDLVLIQHGNRKKMNELA